MKAQIRTTITSTIDLDSFDTSHSVEIDDEDGLSEISADVVGAVLIGALDSTRRALREQFPGAARADDRSTARQEAEAGESGQ